MIQFEAGESRHGNYGVNFLLDPVAGIYAEIPVPEDASEDYGYLTMKYAIIERWEENGRDPADLPPFWYDGQEDSLDPDAKADAPVTVEFE